MEVSISPQEKCKFSCLPFSSDWPNRCYALSFRKHTKTKPKPTLKVKKEIDRHVCSSSTKPYLLLPFNKIVLFVVAHKTNYAVPCKAIPISSPNGKHSFSLYISPNLVRAYNTLFFAFGGNNFIHFACIK